MSAFNESWIFLKEMTATNTYPEKVRQFYQQQGIRAPIPDELRAGHYDSPGEKERKEMAIRQLQEEAYENDPRTIQLREEKRRQGMAEMDRQAEEFATQYQQQTGRPLED